MCACLLIHGASVVADHVMISLPTAKQIVRRRTVTPAPSVSRCRRRRIPKPPMAKSTQPCRYVSCQPGDAAHQPATDAGRPATPWLASTRGTKRVLPVGATFAGRTQPQLTTECTRSCIVAEHRRGDIPMTIYSRGTVLTCTHDDCGCRIRVESECHCADAGKAYQCTCGAPMVEVSDTPTAQAPANEW